MYITFIYRFIYFLNYLFLLIITIYTDLLIFFGNNVLISFDTTVLEKFPSYIISLQCFFVYFKTLTLHVISFTFKILADELSYEFDRLGSKSFTHMSIYFLIYQVSCLFFLLLCSYVNLFSLYDNPYFCE